MRYLWLLFIVCFAVGIVAQNTPAPGTIIPIRLETGLNAKKSSPGQVVKARVMQDVPGTPLHDGAKMLGHVVAVTATAGSGARIALRFDTVVAKKQRIRVTTNLRALASLMEVESARSFPRPGRTGAHRKRPGPRTRSAAMWCTGEEVR